MNPNTCEIKTFESKVCTKAKYLLESLKVKGFSLKPNHLKYAVFHVIFEILINRGAVEEFAEGLDAQLEELQKIVNLLSKTCFVTGVADIYPIQPQQIQKGCLFNTDRLLSVLGRLAQSLGYDVITPASLDYSSISASSRRFATRFWDPAPPRHSFFLAVGPQQTNHPIADQQVSMNDSSEHASNSWHSMQQSEAPQLSADSERPEPPFETSDGSHHDAARDLIEPAESRIKTGEFNPSRPRGGWSSPLPASSPEEYPNTNLTRQFSCMQISGMSVDVQNLEFPAEKDPLLMLSSHV